MDEPTPTNDSSSGYSVAPKAVTKDPIAYMVLTAGLAAYQQTGDTKLLLIALAMYVLPHFAMRLNAQMQDRKYHTQTKS